jgi:hypothetical protein
MQLVTYLPIAHRWHLNYSSKNFFKHVILVCYIKVMQQCTNFALVQKTDLIQITLSLQNITL